MAAQSEQALENLLIKQLESLEYERVSVMSENELLANLKRQLEKHNSIDTKIEQAGKQLDESKQFKKALLQQMFV